MTQGVKISAFALKLIDEADIDFTVGGKPQIWVIPHSKELANEELKENKINEILGTAEYPTSVLQTILKI